MDRTIHAAVTKAYARLLDIDALQPSPFGLRITWNTNAKRPTSLSALDSLGYMSSYEPQVTSNHHRLSLSVAEQAASQAVAELGTLMAAHPVLRPLIALDPSDPQSLMISLLVQRGETPHGHIHLGGVETNHLLKPEHPVSGIANILATVADHPAPTALRIVSDHPHGVSHPFWGNATAARAFAPLVRHNPAESLYLCEGEHASAGDAFLSPAPICPVKLRTAQEAWDAIPITSAMKLYANLIHTDLQQRHRNGYTSLQAVAFHLQVTLEAVPHPEGWAWTQATFHEPSGTDRTFYPDSMPPKQAAMVEDTAVAWCAFLEASAHIAPVVRSTAQDHTLSPHRLILDIKTSSSGPTLEHTLTTAWWGMLDSKPFTTLRSWNGLPTTSFPWLSRYHRSMLPGAAPAIRAWVAQSGYKEPPHAVLAGLT